MIDPDLISADNDGLLRHAQRARRLARDCTDRAVAEALIQYAVQCERELADLIDAAPRAAG